MVGLLLKKLGHTTTSGQVLPGIDGLRALAVTMVLVFHIYGFGAGSPPLIIFNLFDISPWLSTGFLGVDLFFALSGFLLMLPWAKSYYQNTTIPNVRSYFKRRFFRIAPAYYVQLLFLFLIFVPIALPDWSNYSKLGLFTIFTHISFMHYLFPVTSSGLGINGALWTLTIEACFYVSLPFIARLFLGPNSWKSLLISLCIAELWKFLSFHQMYDFLVWATVTILPKMSGYRYDPLVLKMFLANQFPSQLFNFTIGMYFANLYYGISIPMKSIFEGLYGDFLIFTLILVLGYLAWLVGRIDVHGGLWTYIWFIGVSVTCAGLVFLSSHQNIISNHLLGASWIRLIGIISYSIYLWHFPVIYFVKKYFSQSSLVGIDKFYGMLIICIPITLIISFFSYRYIELPFLNMAKPNSHASK
jgi:peptidoglycan/LPS O-acetylase OafA/YrhL